jgi:hypothetical protein
VNRRNSMAAAGLFVVAALVAGVLYVSNLKADEPVAPNKARAPQTSAEQIKQLQARIASLEERIAALEKRPASVWLSPATAPALISPVPSLVEPQDGNDGFPPARILLINGQPTVTNTKPAR